MRANDNLEFLEKTTSAENNHAFTISLLIASIKVGSQYPPLFPIIFLFTECIISKRSCLAVIIGQNQYKNIILYNIIGKSFSILPK